MLSPSSGDAVLSGSTGAAQDPGQELEQGAMVQMVMTILSCQERVYNLQRQALARLCAKQQHVVEKSRRSQQDAVAADSQTAVAKPKPKSKPKARAKPKPKPKAPPSQRQG